MKKRKKNWKKINVMTVCSLFVPILFLSGCAQKEPQIVEYRFHLPGGVHNLREQNRELFTLKKYIYPITVQATRRPQDHNSKEKPFIIGAMEFFPENRGATGTCYIIIDNGSRINAMLPIQECETGSKIIKGKITVKKDELGNPTYFISIPPSKCYKVTVQKARQNDKKNKKEEK